MPRPPKKRNRDDGSGDEAAGGKERRPAKTTADDPESNERKRLKDLAFSAGILSRAPAAPTSSSLKPSKIVLGSDGRDVVKKGQRKNKFLFAFPGLMAPISGGKIGELAGLNTKNPVLYLDFPQGRMKLFGTIIYPKNKYLTLHFSRSSKNVLCEDCFETMVVFSDAWWIGRKEDNPGELKLDFPKELQEGKHAECDFKGGAGAGAQTASRVVKSSKEQADRSSPGPKSSDDASEDFEPLVEKTPIDVIGLTPTRQSARTSGKKFKYAESSSPDDVVDEESEEEPSSYTVSTKKKERPGPNIEKKLSHATIESPMVASSVTVKADNKSKPKRGSLVQTTLSSLFQKAEEKISKEGGGPPPTSKGASRRKETSSSAHVTQIAKVQVAKSSEKHNGGKKAGIKTLKNQMQLKVDEDYLEDISSDSED